MVSEPIIVRFLPPTAASTVVAFVMLTHAVGLVPRAFAIGFVVAAWACAILVTRRDLRMKGVVALSIAAVTASGQVEAGTPFIVASGLFAVACLAALRASQRESSTPRGRIPLGARILFLLTAASVSGLLLAGLPPLALKVNAKIASIVTPNIDQATAFSTQMVLGSTRGMLQSNNVAMRIEGDVPEYLRGAVYDRYEAPHWITTSQGRALHTVAATLAFGPETSRLTLTRRAPVGEDMRWFLPVDACALGEPSGSVQVDAFGVARREVIAPPASMTFRFKGCARGLSTVAPPSRMELEVAPSLKNVLTPLAVSWTEGARTDREKAEALHHALRKLEYSLEVERNPTLDPIVDFLTVHRSGARKK
jgi:hypothetical protein